MNKKGAAGLIVGIIVALVVVGGIAYFAISGGDDSGKSGTSSPSGTQSSGTQTGTSGTGDFAWCTGSYPLFSGYEFKGITTYKGQKACHAILTIQGGTQEYYILSEDGKDFWQIADYPGTLHMEFHMVDGNCVAGDCP